MNRKIIAMLVISLFILSSCDFLVDEEIQEIGKSGTYTDCANLDTSENKHRIDECYSYVGKRQNDPAACEAASKNYKDSCFEDVAVDLHSEELCNKISGDSYKRSCYTDIAVYKKDPALCTNLKGSDINKCYREYSIDADDFDTCGLIPDKTDESDECYLHFALKDSNHELCAGLNSKSNRDKCYYDIATTNSNDEFCGSINDNSKKEQCYEAIEQASEQSEGCKYDSECESICDGEIMWKMGCNPRTGECEKTFDYDCRKETETFSGTEFPKTCSQGQCVRNQVEIDATKAALEDLQDEISDNVKSLLAYRQEVNTLKLDANKKCLNALADVTNKFIIDNAVKLGSIAGSGVSFMKSGSSIVSSTTSIKYAGGKFTTIVKPSYSFTTKFTSDAAGYFGDWTDKLIETMSKLNQAPQDAKPPVEDYIAFWCDYNKYLGEVLDATGEQLDQQLAVAEAIEEEINNLPT